MTPVGRSARAPPGRLAEQLEVALGLGVWPLVDHDLATDELVAVERIAEHDVAGVADEDTAVLGLDQLGQPLDGDLLDVEAVGVAGHGLDPGRAGELADHGVGRERVGEDHLAAGGRLEVGLMRGEPLVDADVEGDVDLLAGPAEVGVDVRADVAEVVALLTGGERRGRARDRHQGDALFPPPPSGAPAGANGTPSGRR